MSDPDLSGDLTQLLDDVRRGVPEANEALALAVYDQLHRIATNALRHESEGHTLQPTELVHESFVRLLGQRATTWQNRAHFFAVAANTIRRILVDHARRRRSLKRDHGIQVTLDDHLKDEQPEPLDLIALDTALHQLDALSTRQARVVELRFFGGLDFHELSEVLGISESTAKRDWVFARAFLLQSLSTA